MPEDRSPANDGQPTRRMAAAYEAAPLAVSVDDMTLLPDKATRAAMLAALKVEAKRNPLDVEALTNAEIRGANEW